VLRYTVLKFFLCLSLYGTTPAVSEGDCGSGATERHMPGMGLFVNSIPVSETWDDFAGGSHADQFDGEAGVRVPDPEHAGVVPGARSAPREGPEGGLGAYVNAPEPHEVLQGRREH